jgi:hypothetical protein
MTATAAMRMGPVPRRNPVRDDAAEECAHAGRGVERTRNARALPELLVGEHRQPGHERLSQRVRRHDHDHRRAEERVPCDVPQAGERAARVRRLLGARAAAHERPHEHEGDEERRGVDVQHVRRADGGNQHARNRGPGELVEALRPLHHAVGARHEPLVLAHDLRQDEPLGREIRPAEDARSRDEDEQQPERERARGVQQRDGRDDRHAPEVADEHGRPCAEPGHDLTAGDAQHRDRHEFGAEHEAHARR